MWGKPQAPRPDGETSAEDEAAWKGLVAHGGLLPRAVISQQQGGGQQQHTAEPHPPGTMNYFNIPPPPPPERSFYPSIDPQRMEDLVPNSQEASDSKGGSEKQPRAPEGSRHPYPAGPPPPHFQGQYPPFYPAYGYMGPPPPAFQQYPPYQQMVAPPRPQPPQPPPVSSQQYQTPGMPGSSSQN
ncbi:zinc finger CCCH domain-containing protein 49-like [Iris pallida]|uniref:Zinc finger CCCH domain-containing protein 49-like n=1 Tax=Iris pallida TaxID=29817 RepID=A0AAX6I819_IRIPA|nr:zinc finger CCCH domain-containing protein 49-like [Iris pallida]